LIKIFIILLFTFSLLKANVNKDISKTNKKITTINKTYNATYTKVRKIKKELKLANKELNGIKWKIKKLIRKKSKTTKYLKSKNIQLDHARSRVNHLNNKIKKNEQKIINSLLKDVSLILVFSKTKNDSINSIIQSAVFEKYTYILNVELNKRNEKLSYMRNLSVALDKKVKSILFNVRSIKSNIKKLKKLQKKQQKVVQKVYNSKHRLDISMNQISNKKLYLAKVLRKLKVLKQKKTNKRVSYNNSSNKIKQIHSSYQRVSVFNYRGKKTISPLKKARLLEKFGSSYDDVYKMKVFNEFIVLSSLSKNQKVRTVLSGTVVFAGRASSLNNTVIIKHRNGIHTVYANLSQIAPHIKKKKYIKKGFVLGKVRDELIFEVTKNNKFINPTKFIRL